MKAGNRIRVFMSRDDTKDYTVEEFRHCLGIFVTDQDREAANFMPLCELYEHAPDAQKIYISNYGESYDKWVQGWMDLSDANGQPLHTESDQ